MNAQTCLYQLHFLGSYPFALTACFLADVAGEPQISLFGVLRSSTFEFGDGRFRISA